MFSLNFFVRSFGGIFSFSGGKFFSGKFQVDHSCSLETFHRSVKCQAAERFGFEQ